MTVKIDFKIDNTKLVKHLATLKQKSRDNLKQVITNLAIRLTNIIKRDKLTGQVLKVQTGRLRNSIHYSVINSPSLISGLVATTNVKYAKIHEYGYNGPVTIKSHLRNIKQAFGKSIKAKDITIKSYVRNTNFKERSFMNSALREFTPTIKREIAAAVRSME